MEKSSTHAEIIDGVLIINGSYKFSIEGLQELALFSNLSAYSEHIQEVLFSQAQICAFIFRQSSIDPAEIADCPSAFPLPASLYFLKTLADILKRMER